jgi:hypothetical protein
MQIISFLTTLATLALITPASAGGKKRADKIDTVIGVNLLEPISPSGLSAYLGSAWSAFQNGGKLEDRRLEQLRGLDFNGQTVLRLNPSGFQPISISQKVDPTKLKKGMPYLVTVKAVANRKGKLIRIRAGRILYCQGRG